MTDALLWLAPLAIGVVFGCAWGYTWGLSRSSAPLPDTSGDWRAGYVTGYDDAREEALRVAKAHDFAMIEQQVSRMQPRP